MAHFKNDESSILDNSIVKVYQGMLNRHFYPKSVFIFDADLVDKIRDLYDYVGS